MPSQFPITETQLILKKDKICEFKVHVDDMKSMITRYFDSIFELVDEFSIVFNDQLSDQEVIIQKLIKIMEKKQTEINEQNLYRVQNFLEHMIKEIERQYERVKDTNKVGWGRYIPNTKEKLNQENQIYKAVEGIRQDQTFIDSSNKATNIFRKKIKAQSLFSSLYEGQRIQGLMMNENYLRVKEFAKEQKNQVFKCQNCLRTNNFIRCARSTSDPAYVNCENNFFFTFKNLMIRTNLTDQQIQQNANNYQGGGQSHPGEVQMIFAPKDNNAIQNLHGRIILLQFDNQIKLVMRMDTPFKANYFMQISQYTNLFEENCKLFKMCKKKLIWDPYFGMIPPLYRDVWLQNFSNHYFHNQCYVLQKGMINN
eukprot:403342848